MNIAALLHDRFTQPTLVEHELPCGERINITAEDIRIATIAFEAGELACAKLDYSNEPRKTVLDTVAFWNECSVLPKATSRIIDECMELGWQHHVSETRPLV